MEVTGLLKRSCGYRYLMVVLDRFSRFVHAIPLIGISSGKCFSAFIYNCVALFGCPQKFFVTRKLKLAPLYGMKYRF